MPDVSLTLRNKRARQVLAFADQLLPSVEPVGQGDPHQNHAEHRFRTRKVHLVTPKTVPVQFLGLASGTAVSGLSPDSSANLACISS